MVDETRVVRVDRRERRTLYPRLSMSCECRERFEEEGRRKFVEKFGEDAIGGDVSSIMAGVFVLSGNSMKHRLALPVEVSGLIFNKRRTGASPRRNTFDDGRECAVYVQRSPASRSISEGDSLWWQGQSAYWTPKNRAFEDLRLGRIGCSGVSRPATGGENG